MGHPVIIKSTMSYYLFCYLLLSLLFKNVGHSRDIPRGGVPICQVRHRIQSIHLLLHVQGLQKGHGYGF